MSRIRKLEIENFRGIKTLSWLPSNGINCLIGSGDSGKSTVLDAIDYCLGARRNLQITDVDFHNLDVDEPIQITLTIGALDDALKSMDSYGIEPHRVCRRPQLVRSRVYDKQDDEQILS